MIILRWFPGTVLLLALLSSPVAEAGPGDPLTLEGYRASPIYKKALSLCMRHPELSSDEAAKTSLYEKLFWSSTRQSIGALTLNTADIVDFYAEHGLSRAYIDLVNYPPFELAVDDCAQGDEKKANHFTLRFLMVDLAGNAAALASVAATGCIVKALSSSLAARLRIPPKALKIGGAAVAGSGLFYQVFANRYNLGISKISPQQQKAMSQALDQQILSGPAQLLHENIQDFSQAIASLDAQLKDPKVAGDDRKKLSHRRDLMEQALDSQQAALGRLEASSNY